MELRGLSQVLNLDPLRLLEGQGALRAILAKLSGTEVEALLAGRTQEGLLLELIGGRTVVAGGDLPFPDGTQLLLRAVPSSDGGALRLQLLEATPPPPAPLLAPLEQGEASALLQRILGAESLPELFAPLQALLAQAAESAAVPEAPAPAPSPSAPPLPTAAAPAALPPEAAPAPAALPVPASLSLAPQPSASTLPAPFEALPPLLQTWIREALPEAMPAPTSASTPSSPPLPNASALTEDLAARGVPIEEAKAWATFLLEAPESETPLPPTALVFTPSLPVASTAEAPAPPTPWQEALRLLFPSPKEASSSTATALSTTTSSRPPLSSVLEELRRAQVPEPLLQRLLPLLALVKATPSGGAVEQLLKALLPRLVPPPPPEVPRTAPSLPSPTSAAPTQARAAAAAPETWKAPETWETWMRGSTGALADAKVSPREAPFHALQAREGTALFELPLPLPGLRGPVELWVERDREGGGGSEAPVRMLVALDLEGMGQVRLGVEGQGGRIRADLWVEEDRRAAVAQALGSELGDPPPYPVRVRGFHGPQPGLRRVAGAGGFGALG